MIDDDKMNMGAAGHQMRLYIDRFEANPLTLPELYMMPNVILGVLLINWSCLSEAERGSLAATAAALHIHSQKPGAYFRAWLRAVGRLVIRKLSSAS
jgi:hypothetical protein